MALMEGGRLVRHDAGQPDFLQHKRRVTGRSLAVPTLAERLTGSGGAIIFSNVSPGAAYAHDPDGFGRVYHRAGSFGHARVPLPEDEQLRVTKDVEGDRAMTERFIREAVLPESDPPALAVLWLGEPDATQHALPMGSPGHLAVLAEADRNAGRVMDAVATLADRDDVLLLIGSDHGHQTVSGVIDIDEELVTAGLKERLNRPTWSSPRTAPRRCSTSIPISSPHAARRRLSRQSGMGGNRPSRKRAGVGGAGWGSRPRFCGFDARER